MPIRLKFLNAIACSEPVRRQAHIPVAFFADDKLKRIAIAGGTPVTLCEAKPPGPAGGAWNHDGVILFAGEDGLYRVPVSGGVVARITQADAARHETDDRRVGRKDRCVRMRREVWDAVC